MDIFYHAMNYTTNGIIDASFYGASKRKSAEEANRLIEDLAKSNYRALSETSGRSSRLRGGGVIKLNRMISIKAKLDAMMNKLGNYDRRMYLAHEVGTTKENEQKSVTNEGLAHEGPY